MVTYHLAKSDFEIESAVALISRVYAREGYVKSEEGESGVSAYLRSSTSVTFLACVGETPVGTISLVGDSERYLPMDLIYREELTLLRNTKTRLAEVCQFAIDTELLKEEKMGTQLDVSTSLLSLVVAHARSKDYTHLTFTVNPKHRKFYEMLGAVQIGGEKSYPSVENAPALGYVLDMTILNNAEEQSKVRHFLVERILNRVPVCVE
ncbi:hypothetical protein IPH92_03265 [Candidatus Kaiserbacteria bacterium]|nr:MAG: hypothetical protein IPH92_03265 [Candidatus Kaiserbacteria bacterium]